jgi:hypothetical protein
MLLDIFNNCTTVDSKARIKGESSIAEGQRPIHLCEVFFRQKMKNFTRATLALKLILITDLIETV